MGLVAPWHVGSSWTTAWTHVPCIGRRILNHCTTREARLLVFLNAKITTIFKCWLFAGTRICCLVFNPQTNPLRWVLVPFYTQCNWGFQHLRYHCGHTAIGWRGWDSLQISLVSKPLRYNTSNAARTPSALTFTDFLIPVFTAPSHQR